LTDAGAARFLDAGEAALVVEFGRTIEPAVHQRVLALDAALTKRALPGVTELVPTIRSLMIHYDPLIVDRETLIAAVRGVETGTVDTKPKRRWRIPLLRPQFGETSRRSPRCLA
jgi:allophanate hydrolase subunit 1